MGFNSAFKGLICAHLYIVPRGNIRIHGISQTVLTSRNSAVAVYTRYTNVNSTAKFLSYGRHGTRQEQDYRAVPTQTSELTGNVLLLLIYLVIVKIIKGVFHLDISFFCQFRAIRPLFCAFRVS